ncbi:hypothetical protein C8A03DRAFT_38387, partial [Achaetomium macrosporum]
MIRLSIWLIAFLQVALCKPLLERDSGCITTTHKVNAKDYQDVIDPMSGFISPVAFGGNEGRELTNGSCAGTIFNKMTTSINVNLSDVASIMTEHIFKPCITQGMYGRWETDTL